MKKLRRSTSLLMAIVLMLTNISPALAVDFSLSININGSGSVNINPPDINCSSTCTNILSDPEVTLTANATTGSFFAGWSDGVCSGINLCVVTMNADQTVTATFTLDGTAPTVDTFTVTTPSTSLNIPITAFTATDNEAVIGYLVTASATPPLAGNSGWTATAPASYTVAADGSYTLYPWARDAAGNVSSTFASPRPVSVDTTAPTITITNPSTSPAQSKTITAITSEGNLEMSNTRTLSL